MHSSYASCEHSQRGTAAASHPDQHSQPSPWSGQSKNVPSPEDFENAPLLSAFSVVKQLLQSQEALRNEILPTKVLDSLLQTPELGESPDCDLESITKRRYLLKLALQNDETEEVLSLFRDLTRNVGGIGNAYVGAPGLDDKKHTFNRYKRTVLQTTAEINRLFDASEDRDQRLHIYECVCDTISAFGKSATLLSGGGTMGMYHIGVLKSLRNTDPRLVSQIISGASAGSIVASVFASKREEDLEEAVQQLCHGDLEVFTSADERDMSYLQRFKDIRARGRIYDAKNLERVMKDLLGEKLTFKDAFHLTGKKLNITVSTSDSEHNGYRLLNHINSPDVVIWSAVVASCAVPFFFPAGQLYFRDTDENLKRVDTPVGHLDGSIYGDVPMDRISREFNVNYFVASQVNPHVVGFLVKDKTQPRSTLYSCWDQAKSHLRCAALSALDPIKEYTPIARPFFGAIYSTLHQRYEGDLTIFPITLLKDWRTMLKCLLNPTDEFMDTAVKQGHEEAEKMLAKAHAVLDVEMMLQDLRIQLKTKLKFSKSEEDLHRKEIEHRMQSSRSYTALSRRGDRGHNSSKSVALPSARCGHNARAHRTSQSLELGYMQLNISAEKVAGSIYDSETSAATDSDDAENSGDEDDSGLRIAMPTRNLQRFTSNPPSPIDTRRRSYFPSSRSTSRSSSRSSSPGGPAASLNSLRMTPRTPSPEQTRKVAGLPLDQGTGGKGAKKDKWAKSLRSLLDRSSGIPKSSDQPALGRDFRRKKSLSSNGLVEWMRGSIREEEQNEKKGKGDT